MHAASAVNFANSALRETASSAFCCWNDLLLVLVLVLVVAVAVVLAASAVAGGVVVDKELTTDVDVSLFEEEEVAGVLEPLEPLLMVLSQG